MESYRDMTGAAAKRKPEMLEMLAELAGIESPTEDRAGVNRCVSLVEGWIRGSGGKSQRFRQRIPSALCSTLLNPRRTDTNRPVWPLLLGKPWSYRRFRSDHPRRCRYHAPRNS